MTTLSRLLSIIQEPDDVAQAIATALEENDTRRARQIANASVGETKLTQTQKTVRHYARRIAYGAPESELVECLQTVWRYQGRAFEQGEAAAYLRSDAHRRAFVELCSDFVRFIKLRATALRFYRPYFGADRQEDVLFLIGLEEHYREAYDRARDRRAVARFRRFIECNAHAGPCTCANHGRTAYLGRDVALRTSVMRQVIENHWEWRVNRVPPTDQEREAAGYVPRKGMLPKMVGGTAESRRKWAEFIECCSEDSLSLRAACAMALQVDGVRPWTGRISRKRYEDLPVPQRETEQGFCWSF